MAVYMVFFLGIPLFSGTDYIRAVTLVMAAMVTVWRLTTWKPECWGATRIPLNCHGEVPPRLDDFATGAQW